MYEALKARPDIRPDLVVAHSGFGSSLFLPYLYDAPIINFFEWFYRPVGQDLGYRPELPVTEAMLLRSRARNAMILLDLDNCDRGWCPNEYQRSLFPEPYKSKIEVIPEGVDTRLYRRDPKARLRLRDGSELPAGTKGGRPMLQVPLTLEQQVLARRVEQTGAGETVNRRGEGVGEEVRRKLRAVATEPRYAEAARRFALKYSNFDPEAQVRRMVDRVEELIERGRGAERKTGRQGDTGTRRQGAVGRRGVFAG